MDLHMPIVNGWQAAERIRKMVIYSNFIID